MNFLHFFAQVAVRGEQHPLAVPLLLRQGGRAGVRSLAGAPLLWGEVWPPAPASLLTQVYNPMSSR